MCLSVPDALRLTERSAATPTIQTFATLIPKASLLAVRCLSRDCTPKPQSERAVTTGTREELYANGPATDAFFNLLLELPPVDQVFLSAILVRYACT